MHGKGQAARRLARSWEIAGPNLITLIAHAMGDRICNASPQLIVRFQFVFPVWAERAPMYQTGKFAIDFGKSWRRYLL